MSANNRLSFAGINDMTLWRGGTNTNVTTFIRFTSDNDGASNLLTYVTYNSGQQLDHILVGQQLLITGVGLTDNKTEGSAVVEFEKLISGIILLIKVNLSPSAISISDEVIKAVIADPSESLPIS